ncbi:MAG: hypothetical protein JSV80_08415, partial [Acidobacteriota bacterium]
MSHPLGETTMTRQASLFVLVLLASTAAVGQAVEHRPLAGRARRISAQRSDAAQRRHPESAPLPEKLRDFARESADATSGSPLSKDLALVAHRAARWAADRLASSEGRFALAKIGFYNGLHTGLAASDFDRVDYLEGRSDARKDPDPHHRGVIAGEQTAAALAADLAPRRVASQFADLSADPVYDDRSIPPAYAPELLDLATPLLEDVFADHRVRIEPTDGDATLADFLVAHVDARHFFKCGSWEQVANADWNDAERAFALWVREHRLARVYQSLDSRVERNAFRRHFVRQFDHRLSRLLEGPELLGWYERAFEAGWEHGSLIRSEWQYRRGYRQGVINSHREAATRSFANSYPPQYARAYAKAFSEWSSQVRPDLRAIRVRDGNGDGVFEPGEDLLVDVELANHGGANGTVRVDLSGDLMTIGAELDLYLPRRQLVSFETALRGVIRPEIRPKQQGRLVASLGDQRRSVSVRVAFPLELDSIVGLLEHDVLT